MWLQPLAVQLGLPTKVDLLTKIAAPKRSFAGVQALFSCKQKYESRPKTYSNSTQRYFGKQQKRNVYRNGHKQKAINSYLHQG